MTVLTSSSFRRFLVRARIFVYLFAAAGVVADSVPDLEWKETMDKGRAVFRAVALAEAGLGSHPCQREED